MWSALGEQGEAWALQFDDLSTPGSYWLNPALPRDLEGNWVDPETGIGRAAEQQALEAPLDGEGDEDEESTALRAIIDDIGRRSP